MVGLGVMGHKPSRSLTSRSLLGLPYPLFSGTGLHTVENNDIVAALAEQRIRVVAHAMRQRILILEQPCIGIIHPDRHNRITYIRGHLDII